MTWKPLRLEWLSILGPEKAPASLQFVPGVNVICGASDTGKTFVLEAIDFLLGAKDPPRDFPERQGYDRARLVVQPFEQPAFTLERSLAGGNFEQFEGIYPEGTPSTRGRTLGSVHERGQVNTVSAQLLLALGIDEKFVLTKKKDGTTQSLSFRNLAPLVIVPEDDIVKRTSPLLSKRNATQTLENSVFKFLLTETDDSAIVELARRKQELDNTKKQNTVKIQFIDELIAELQPGIDRLSMTRAQIEDRRESLEAQIEQQKTMIEQLQEDLEGRTLRRREVGTRLEQTINRVHEIGSLLQRFDLLRQHYEVDIERLHAIQESGSLFVYLEQTPCPLCGSLPDVRNHTQACDGNVEAVVHAASAEIAKIEKLLRELDQTVQDLNEESEELLIEQSTLQANFQALDREISDTFAPAFGEAQNAFSELVQQRADIQQNIDLFSRYEQLSERKAALIAKNSERITLNTIQSDPPDDLIGMYAQKVQHILEVWHFPEVGRVWFDKSKKDMVIGDRPRGSRGKGLRAITHAAMTIGLMELCKERNLPHPGFVILDSPLLAYYEPEGDDDNLEGSDLKNQFYEYLITHHKDSQIIIIDNQEPPEEVERGVALTKFTKNPEMGRYGFFPPLASN